MLYHTLLIFILLSTCGNSILGSNIEIDRKMKCNENGDCNTGFRCKTEVSWFGRKKNYCSDEKCYRESSCCKGQCGEGEGFCDSNDDCLPGFECKNDRKWSLFAGRGYCRENFRSWKCDKFPKWLQKTYRVRGLNFCKDQWDSEEFWNDQKLNSQPKCSEEVLPTVTFYDGAENELLCVLNMNEMKNADSLSRSCNNLLSQLSTNKEFWVVYIVHGFTNAEGSNGWYPKYRTAISKRYKKKNRKIIIGEVVWKDGSNAIFDTTALPEDLRSSLNQQLAAEDRTNTEILFDAFLCTSHGIEGGVVSGYSKAASNTMVVGHAIGKLTEALSSTMNTVLKSFCIGHSLGSHVCGFAGKTRKLDGIIGLDPAGPIFEDNFIDGRLSKEDAHFVQALHFDAGEMGIDQAIGHQDIFINGGKTQPGCRGAVSEAACSHTPFALNFLLKMMKQDHEDALCYANKKCKNESQAMKKKSYKKLRRAEVEVGALMDRVTKSNQGIFYLDTEKKVTGPCYFTIDSLDHDAYGYSDFIKGINLLNDILIPQINFDLGL